MVSAELDFSLFYLFIFFALFMITKYQTKLSEKSNCSKL